MSDLQTGIAAMMAEQVRHNAAQRLQTVIETLEMSIHEIERYQAKLNDAACDTERAELMNWTVQFLVCYAVPNMRIDLLADSQFELKALAQE